MPEPSPPPAVGQHSVVGQHSISGEHGCKPSQRKTVANAINQRTTCSLASKYALRQHGWMEIARVLGVDVANRTTASQQRKTHLALGEWAQGSAQQGGVA